MIQIIESYNTRQNIKLRWRFKCSGRWCWIFGQVLPSILEYHTAFIWGLG